MNTFPIHQSLPYSFLLIVLLFFMPASSSAQDCSPSLFECGNVKLRISYPFWTKGRPEYCGYPNELEIKCNKTDNSSEIVIQSRKYHVMKINYENQTATIVDKDYYFANKDMTPCRRPSSNTSIDINLFNYTKGDLNLSFLYNCPFLVQDNPDFRFFNCSSNHYRDYAYFTFLQHITGPFINCHVIQIPILELNRDLLLEKEKAEEYWIDVLAGGFEVTWSSSDLDYRCRDCVKSNGHCRFDETSPQKRACYCNGASYPDMCPLAQGPGGDKSRRKILIGVTIGVGVLILTCSFFYIISLVTKLPSDNFVFFWKKKTYDTLKVEEFLENYGSLVPKRYRYSELKGVTKSFKEKLGQGGYGSVFKGKLNDGRPVAVKVLNNSKGGNGEEFINEVASIGRTYHVNVVTLLGFCSEGSKRALVYEFMSKGSLEKFIFSNKVGGRHILDCQRLFQIAVGIARGLEYLHRGCSTRIVHFDIKPHNILLDDDFCPKISDFGLAKLCPQQQSTLSMLDARGTIGYTAPEVFCRNIGGVSHKSDVYSYGMMVLEMIGGRKNIDAKVEKTSEIYFPHWVYKHIELKESLGFLGFCTEAEEDIGRKMVLVGLWCIQTDPTNRPSMTKVVEMLEGSLGSLEMPPKPYLSSPSRSCSSTT
ncbi:LEAF RUST 10 DISEASE-RESISTANCE LOCUS RECEPTOR-LIKE PROTEIN KINASE-like protein 2.1 isoform X3 [Cinnamomum micranthum f. kanehirae]|uniref:non-specific serine/threonine protein kinase n=1 Tax=Cinnamomum micranthum f. kanehirae TaxID=337451 RepID=A0A443NU75_9MAGN|nr:LEAF RUST 10 DISEASE-RESISTANCE LOCUS RECEPTOR-LIKE PROTEIN KINASE-like protein 2.1 isoform X3 [Cinnamomum micranthum f. kanehirae]